MPKGFQSREEASRAGRLGGLKLHAQRRAWRGDAPPYAGSMLDAMTAAGMSGPSWDAWRTFWRVVDALPLEPGDRDRYREATGRSEPPTAPPREVYVVAGRRSGKSHNAALRSMWIAARRQWGELLAKGEVATLPVIAADRDQARNVLAFIKGLAQTPAFAPLIRRVLRDSVEL